MNATMHAYYITHKKLQAYVFGQTGRNMQSFFTVDDMSRRNRREIATPTIHLFRQWNESFVRCLGGHVDLSKKWSPKDFCVPTTSLECVDNIGNILLRIDFHLHRQQRWYF